MIFLLGLAGGFLSAFFGIGGGIATVPGLALLFRFPLKRAIGTSLAAMLPVALAGVISELFVKGENLRPDLAGALAAGALLGTFAGRAIVSRIPDGGLRVVYAVFLLLVALRLIGVLSVAASPPLAWEEGRWISFAAAAAVGALAGTTSTLFGVGGGVVAVPLCLLLFQGISFHEARATALAMIAPAAAAGIWHHRRLGNVVAGAAWKLAAAGVLGAVAGIVLVQRVPGDTLKALFAILLALAAWRLLRERR